MEESDYSAMLIRLTNDREQILVRLKAIEMAIEAIGQLTSPDFKGLTDLSLNNVNGYSEKRNEKKGPYEDYEIEIIDEYHPEMAPIEKLIYAIYKKKGSFAQEAADYIHKIDQSESLEYLKTRFTDIASGLGRAKKLEIKKIGKKYRYSIPQDILDKYYII